MATANRPIYWTLGTLLIGSRGVDLHGWLGLLGGRTVYGEDVKVPYADDLHVVEREHGGGRGAIMLRAVGEYTEDNVRVTGGDLPQVVQVLNHLAAIRAVTDVKTAQNLTLHVAGYVPLTVPAIVDNPGDPIELAPLAVTVTIELSLPEGPVDLSDLTLEP